MKKIILFIALISCEGNIDPQDNKEPCDKAVDYIESCLGYRPVLIGCTIKNATKILSTSCEDLRTLWE